MEAQAAHGVALPEEDLKALWLISMTQFARLQYAISPEIWCMVHGGGDCAEAR
jgi:hypothetical protein